MSDSFIVFKIPIAVTDNRRHQIAFRVRRLIDTQEYTAWKEAAFLALLQQIPHGWKPLEPTEEDQLCYLIQIMLPSRRVDATNFLKGVQDVMTAAKIWTDDKWVRPQFLPTELDPKEPQAIIVLPLSRDTRVSFWPPRGFLQTKPPEPPKKRKRHS